MYLRYFGFQEYPFAVTPNGEVLYSSASHREASGHLFTRPVIAASRRLIGGVTRLTRMIGERALTGCHAHGRSHVGSWPVRHAARENLSRRRALYWLRAALAVTMVAVGLACLPAHAADGHAAATQDLTRNAPESGKHAGPASTSRKAAAGMQLAKAAEDTPTGEKSADQSGTGAVAAESAPARRSDTSKATAKGEAAKNKPKQTETGGIPDGNADINQLLRLWGVFGAQVQSQCSSLHVGDLRCLADRGSFSMLESYNRPALLVLQQGDKRQTVLLSAIDKDKHKVTLVGKHGARQIARSELLQLWTGQFQVVWRADSGMRLIQPGAVGNGVVWLRRRLAQIKDKDSDTKPGSESPVYDDALEAELKHFQSAHGLEPDGMVGPRTQIMLNGAVPSPGAPQLVPVKK